MRVLFEHIVSVPLETVFAFFDKPANLALLHRGRRSFRLLWHENRVRLGGEIWIEETIAGFVPVVLGLRHTVYEPPIRFGESLIHGPFRRFDHLHEFVGKNNGTLIRDLLEIELPLVFGGQFAARAILEPQIRRLFQFRQRSLERLAQSGVLSRCGPLCAIGQE
jgi:ligand-binding SRPBCC domain-containing protein